MTRSKRGGRNHSGCTKRSVPAKVFLATLPEGVGDAGVAREPSYIDTTHLLTTFPEVVTAHAIFGDEKLRASTYPMKLHLQGSPLHPLKLNRLRSPLAPLENCAINGFNRASLSVKHPSAAVAAAGRHAAEGGRTKASSQRVNLVLSRNSRIRGEDASSGSDLEQVKLEDDPQHIDIPPWIESLGALSGSDIENVATECQPQRMTSTQLPVFVDVVGGSDAEQTTTNASWGMVLPPPRAKAPSKYCMIASSASDVQDDTTKHLSHLSQRSALWQSKANSIASSGSEAELAATVGSTPTPLRCVVVGSRPDAVIVMEELSKTCGSHTEHIARKPTSQSVALSATARSDAPLSKKPSFESTITNDIKSFGSCAMPSSTDKISSALLPNRSNVVSAGMEADVTPFGSTSCDDDENVYFPLHVCVVQASLGGLSNWSLGNVRTSYKWDELLDVLLQCLVVDGHWVSCTKASAFVGSDSIHLDHRIQNLADANALSSLRRHKQYTIQERAVSLWRNYLVDQPGLRWRCCFRGYSRKCTQQLLLNNIRSQLNGHNASGVVLIMDFWSSITYEELKEKGAGLEPFRKSPVYIILPGRYGFDGCRDTTDAFVQDLILCFEQHFGSRCTTRVNITTSCSSYGKCTPEVGAFISTEISSGAMQQVVAGAVHLASQH